MAILEYQDYSSDRQPVFTVFQDHDSRTNETFTYLTENGRNLGRVAVATNFQETRAYIDGADAEAELDARGLTAEAWEVVGDFLRAQMPTIEVVINPQSEVWVENGILVIGKV